MRSSVNEVHTRKEVANPFKIDLHIRHLDDILEVGVGLDDRLEDLFGDTGNETFEFRRVDVRALVHVSYAPPRAIEQPNTPSW